MYQAYFTVCIMVWTISTVKLSKIKANITEHLNISALLPIFPGLVREIKRAYRNYLYYHFNGFREIQWKLKFSE